MEHSGDRDLHNKYIMSASCLLEENMSVAGAILLGDVTRMTQVGENASINRPSTPFAQFILHWPIERHFGTKQRLTFS